MSTTATARTVLSGDGWHQRLCPRLRPINRVYTVRGAVGDRVSPGSVASMRHRHIKSTPARPILNTLINRSPVRLDKVGGRRQCTLRLGGVDGTLRLGDHQNVVDDNLAGSEGGR